MHSILNYSQQFREVGIAIPIFTEQGYERKALAYGQGMKTRRACVCFCFCKQWKDEGKYDKSNSEVCVFIFKVSFQFHITPAVAL